MSKKEKILLTPDLAKKWLEKNYGEQRKLRTSVIAKYANDMKNGLWNCDVSEEQDPIIISKNGFLLNGQHRCNAVIKANTPIYTYVSYGADESIFRYLDDGAKRGARDYVKIPNAHSVSALARIVCAVEDGDTPLASALQGKMTHNVEVSRQQILKKIDDNEEAFEAWVRSGMRAATYLGNKKGHVSAALSIIDFCERGDVMNRFVDECSAMVTNSQPVNMLRAYVAKSLSSSHFNANCKWMCGCIFWAYEAFRSNTEIKSFNKPDMYFSRYDKYVAETREAKRKK